jgi:hypothetical protein
LAACRCQCPVPGGHVAGAGIPHMPGVPMLQDIPREGCRSRGGRLQQQRALLWAAAPGATGQASLQPTRYCHQHEPCSRLGPQARRDVESSSGRSSTLGWGVDGSCGLRQRTRPLHPEPAPVWLPRSPEPPPPWRCGTRAPSTPAPPGGATRCRRTSRAATPSRLCRCVRLPRSRAGGSAAARAFVLALAAQRARQRQLVAHMGRVQQVQGLSGCAAHSEGQVDSITGIVLLDARPSTQLCIVVQHSCAYHWRTNAAVPPIEATADVTFTTQREQVGTQAMIPPSSISFKAPGHMPFGMAHTLRWHWVHQLLSSPSAAPCAWLSTTWWGQCGRCLLN